MQTINDYKASVTRRHNRIDALTQRAETLIDELSEFSQLQDTPIDQLQSASKFDMIDAIDLDDLLQSSPKEVATPSTPTYTLDELINQIDLDEAILGEQHHALSY